MATTAFLGVALFLACVSVSLMPGQPKVSRVNASYQAQIRDDSSMTANIIKLPTENAVDFVQFSSDKVGWLGSQSGEIYSTTDGGTTWRDMTTGGSGFIAKMQFISESTGWIVVATSIQRSLIRPLGRAAKYYRQAMEQKLGLCSLKCSQLS